PCARGRTQIALAMSSPMRILVIEDESKLAAHICDGLRGAGFCPDHAPALADAQILVSTVTYEAIVLDLALPDGNGLDLLREARRNWLKHGGTRAYRSILVPTLVSRRIEDSTVSIQAGRFLAKHIPHAKLGELDRSDHNYWFGDGVPQIADLKSDFTTQPAGETQSTSGSRRMLATILF